MCNSLLQKCHQVRGAVLLLVLFVGCTACSVGGTPELNSYSEGEQNLTSKEVLIYANLHPDNLDREGIYKFNMSHDDIQIEVKDYSGENGQKRLLVEIAAGRVPDILDMRGSEGWMPYRRLAANGYLENLWPYLECDPDLGVGSILEAPLKAAEVNGSLYMAFDSVVIHTMIGAKSIVGDRTSWSLDELQEAFSNMPEDATITSYGFDKASMFGPVVSGYLDSCIDWENGECFFDSSSFRAALEFLNLYPSEKEQISDGDIVEATDENSRWLRNGHQMLENTYIHSLNAMNVEEFFFGEPVSFVGYPIEDGSVGSYFGIKGSPLAISAQCRNKEAAWEFVSRKFKHAFIDLSPGGMPEAIPINRDFFEKANLR